MLKNFLRGQEAEKRAIDFLIKNNFKILKQNFRISHKEIDIVASKNNVLHLIEVKSSFYGLKDFLKRNIYTYINAKEFEKQYKSISLDLIILDNNNISFYENISVDYLLS